MTSLSEDDIHKIREKLRQKSEFLTDEHIQFLRYCADGDLAGVKSLKNLVVNSVRGEGVLLAARNCHSHVLLSMFGGYSPHFMMACLSTSHKNGYTEIFERIRQPITQDDIDLHMKAREQCDLILSVALKAGDYDFVTYFVELIEPLHFEFMDVLKNRGKPLSKGALTTLFNAMQYDEDKLSANPRLANKLMQNAISNDDFDLYTVLRSKGVPVIPGGLYMQNTGMSNLSCAARHSPRILRDILEKDALADWDLSHFFRVAIGARNIQTAKTLLDYGVSYRDIDCSKEILLNEPRGMTRFRVLVGIKEEARDSVIDIEQSNIKPLRDLDDLRKNVKTDQGYFETGFVHLAKADAFGEVIKHVSKHKGAALNVSDIFGEDHFKNTVLEILVYRGKIDVLMQPHIWRDPKAAHAEICARLPLMYKRKYAAQLRGFSDAINLNAMNHTKAKSKVIKRRTKR